MYKLCKFSNIRIIFSSVRWCTQKCSHSFQSWIWFWASTLCTRFNKIPLSGDTFLPFFAQGYSNFEILSFLELGLPRLHSWCTYGNKTRYCTTNKTVNTKNYSGDSRTVMAFSLVISYLIGFLSQHNTLARNNSSVLGFLSLTADGDSRKHRHALRAWPMLKWQVSF